MALIEKFRLPKRPIKREEIGPGISLFPAGFIKIIKLPLTEDCLRFWSYQSVCCPVAVLIHQGRWEENYHWAYVLDDDKTFHKAIGTGIHIEGV